MSKKRARYRKYENATLAARSTEHSFDLLSLNNSTSSASSEAPRALVLAMHFPSLQGVRLGSNTTSSAFGIKP
jgi:hypothetical protein